MAIHSFNVLVEPDEDGLYVVTCPALPGCYSQGGTYEEAVENIKGAIKLHIEAKRQIGESVPVESDTVDVRVFSRLHLSNLMKS
ncbi:MAG: protein of unknown function UPF0150 [Dehalococcoidia bacterium]|nr:protein of unknown function UPF0150 [Dehalococcoidia bacterium]